MASFTDTPVADVKRTNTLETLFHTRPRTPLSSNLPVLKMRNIPFDVSIQDILSYFDPIPVSCLRPYRERT